MNEELVLKKRKEKFFEYLKNNYNIWVYLILAMIVFLAVRIRTRNLSGLRDITTGTWTLGPDLDPFLFLRWAKYIVEHGSLFAVDTMRYVPLGFKTSEEYLLHPYLMAWFHKIVVFFGSESVTYSAVIYPVFFFALTVVAFFFLVRKIFLARMGGKRANIIALISSLFLTILPSLMPRTIAGIPEKESVAFFFLFMAFYLFLSAWQSERKYGKYVFAVLAGVSTAAMALIWGGYIFIFMIIGSLVFLEFLLGKVDRKKVTVYSTWLFSSFALMYPFLDSYNLKNLITSTSTGGAIAVLVIILIHLITSRNKLRIKVRDKFQKVPDELLSTIISLILLGFLASLVFGFSFIPSILEGVKDNLIKPATSRLIQTVAENKQPYFLEWVANFGPTFVGIKLFFWLFATGSIFLFYSLLKPLNKRERCVLTISFAIFFAGLVFTRYSSQSIFNGENLISVISLFGGIAIFLASLGFYYFKLAKDKEKIKQIDCNLVFLLFFLVLGIVAARSAVRTVMILVPPSSVIVSYLVVSLIDRARNIDKKGKMLAVILAGIIIVGISFSAYGFYKEINYQASAYVPGVYNQQWQKAMAWVRESTPENSIFGHWWDYGYWVQSIGERATVLDGGNAISYWNHLMGRHALTSPSEASALEFLYAHNVTHFLIDSTDIGKYGAFSIIGSDVNYDRKSWISLFIQDNTKMFESKNSTLSIYAGGFPLDEDLVYENGSEKIFLPGAKGLSDSSDNLAGLGALQIEVGKDKELMQPVGIYVYKQQQYRIPLRYAFYNNELIDFESGLEAGIFFMPLVSQSSSQLQVQENGALLYLSKRTVSSNFARWYLYGEESEYFQLAHKEDDFVVSQLKSQGLNLGDFVYLQGIRGPLKIWEVGYPGNIEFKEEFLSREYPSELREA